MSRYNSNNNSSSIGITFGGLLQIIFIALKLCHVIGWSWVWVFAPTWIGFLILFLVIIGIIIYDIYESNKNNRRK